MTIVALPKPFNGETSILQSAACKSWSVIPSTEVILVGDEEGILEVCKKYNFRQIKDVLTTKLGTPRLDDAFKKAQAVSRSKILLYVNADIILGPEIIESINSIKFPDYLLTGRRYDVNPWDSEADADYQAWSRYAKESGSLVPSFSADYFVFPKASKILIDMPNLIVGRKGWDNWIMYRARELFIPLIDGSDRITAIHRIHGYDHIKFGNSSDRSNLWDGPESREQISLIGNKGLNLEYATHYVDENYQIVCTEINKKWFYHELTFRIIKTDNVFKKALMKFVRKYLNCKFIINVYAQYCFSYKESHR